MVTTLITYSTTDGQTKAICNRIRKVARKPENIIVSPLSEVESLQLSKFDQLVLGASIRYGKHKPEVIEFVNRNKAFLEQIKTCFFSVNVVARKPNKNSPANNPYLIKFLKQTDWQPNKTFVFAGKIDYPNYKFWDKQIIRLIMYMTKGPTDTTRTFEFTDWEKVENVARDLETQ